MKYKHATIPHTKYVEILVKNIKYPSIVVDDRLGLKYCDKTYDEDQRVIDYIFLIKDPVKLALAKLEYEF
jgi:hypothetical protein